jgi:hypothetical protein
MKWLISLGLAAYLFGAVVTYGEEEARIENSLDYPQFTRDNAVVPAFCIGLMWPLYWPFRASYIYFESQYAK